MKPTFYLSSMESARFSHVFACELEGNESTPNGRHGLRVKISPAAEGQDMGQPQGLSEILLFNRFEGDDLWRIIEFPVFVSICLAQDPGATSTGFPDVIAWGEIYRSAEDALSHRMK